MAKKPKVLERREVHKRISALSAWDLNRKGTMLTKVYAVPSFISGLAFIAKVTVHAEILNHHPDVELTYTKVKIKLTTHEVKALTKLDFELAKKIDAIRLNI